MIRTFALAATPLPPADPRAKLPVGPTDRRDPAGQAFVAEWLARFRAPTASLLEAVAKPGGSGRARGWRRTPAPSRSPMNG
jgi:hypothetical protein